MDKKKITQTTRQVSLTSKTAGFQKENRKEAIEHFYKLLVLSHMTFQI